MSDPMSIGPGFKTTTEIDHRSWLWVASFLSVLYSLICLLARFTAKWDFLWFDDIILCSGYLFAFTHWGITFTAISDGLAVSSTSLSDAALRHVSRLYFASRVPLFLAHTLAKMSLLVFTRRIFTGDIYKEHILFGVGYGFVIAYGICSILLSSAGCRPDKALVASINAVCDHNRGRWAAITVLDVLTELAILAMPIWFIQKNQLKASKKRVVILVYMFRLVVTGFAIATTASYLNFLESANDNIGIAPVVAWQETLIGFSLISSSFPCLRAFLWAFMSRGLVSMYGNTVPSIDLSFSTFASRRASVQLRSLRSDSQAPRFPDFRLRPEEIEYRVDIRGNSSGARKQRDDERSDGSDRFFIRHEQSFTVESVRP